jgi:hypothetical protein
MGNLVRGEGSHLWAPQQASIELPKLTSFRRFSESSSDEGSPLSVPNQPLSSRVHVQWYRRHMQHDGYDSSTNNLVCNLVERFNNAQLYDGINESP